MTDQPDNVVPITPDARSAAEKFGAEHNRELLTILFTDLVNSTKLQSELGNVEAARLTELHRKIVRGELAKHDAREIEWAGDSCLAVFTKPSDAVVFALRMQAEHRRARETEPKLPTVRVGMHLGEIVVRAGDTKEDLFGLQVSEAARVMSVARGNQIFCTRAVFDNARSALKGSVIEDVGEVVWVNYGAYLLKGSEDALELCEVGSSDVAVLKAPQPSDKAAPLLPEGVSPYHPLVPSNGTPRPADMSRATLAAVSTLCVVVAVLAVLLWRAAPEAPVNKDAASNTAPPAVEPKPVRRLTLPLMPGETLKQSQLRDHSVAVSPDGSHVAYVATRGGVPRMMLRPLDRDEVIELPETENAGQPAFSPDGESLCFFAEGFLKRVSIAGGVPENIQPITVPLGASWGEGSIVFSSAVRAPMKLLRLDTGDIEPLLDLGPNEGVHAKPHILPGGQGLLFVAATGPSISNSNVELFIFATQERRLLAREATRPHYLNSGHVLVSQEGRFTAIPFDLDALEVTGVPFQIPVDWETGTPQDFGISNNGMLVHPRGAGASSQNRSLVWIRARQPDGTADPAARPYDEEPIDVPKAPYYSVHVSPDGRRAAIGMSDFRTIRVVDLDQGGTPRRLTYPEDSGMFPLWTPDGRDLVYMLRTPLGFCLARKAADGSGETTTFMEGGDMVVPNAVTPDGNTVIATIDSQETDFDIVSVSLEDPGASNVLVDNAGRQSQATLSNDGKWLAYVSNELGQPAIFVRPYPSLDGKWQVSTGVGREPLWAPNGKRLYYRDDDRVMAVDIETEPAFNAGEPYLLFEGAFHRDSTNVTYDRAPGEDRFLMIKPDAEPVAVTALTVVENWFEELKRLAPVPTGNWSTSN